MPLQLQYLDSATVPLEVEGITPCRVRDLSVKEIERIELYHGNQQAALADFFSVGGDPADERMRWLGDLSGVHWIGAKMASGEIQIAGNAGRHVGSEMTGGQVHVEGNVGDWLGGEMHGGLIHVRGRAGHLVGAAYRGSRRGMTGGTILVEGDGGNEIGHTMRRGLVAIGGQTGDLAGFNILAGTILLFGPCGIRHGAGMRRGTIGLFSQERPELLPSFRHGCRYRPLVAPVLWRHLRQLNFAVPEEVTACDFDLYHGDMINGGRGEVLVRA